MFSFQFTRHCGLYATNVLLHFLFNYLNFSFFLSSPVLCLSSPSSQKNNNINSSNNKKNSKLEWISVFTWIGLFCGFYLLSAVETKEENEITLNTLKSHYKFAEQCVRVCACSGTVKYDVDPVFQHHFSFFISLFSFDFFSLFKDTHTHCHMLFVIYDEHSLTHLPTLPNDIQQLKWEKRDIVETKKNQIQLHLKDRLFADRNRMVNSQKLLLKISVCSISGSEVIDIKSALDWSSSNSFRSCLTKAINLVRKTHLIRVSLAFECTKSEFKRNQEKKLTNHITFPSSRAMWKSKK